MTTLDATGGLAPLGQNMGTSSKVKRPKTLTWLRWAIQFGFLAFIMYVATRQQIEGGGPAGPPSVEAYCPFGGLESAWMYITTGRFLHRITSSTLVLAFALVATVVIGKSTFCGWICPLGTIQEWIGAVGKRIFGRQFALPVYIDRPAQHLRYIVLVWVIVSTAIYGALVFREYDPFIALAHLGAFEEVLAASVILALVLGASLFVDRPWCRYFCPLGAFIGLLGKISLFKIERDSVLCRGCAVCNKVCKAGVDVAHASRIADDTCTQCLACTEICPVKGALALRLPRLGLLKPLQGLATGARQYGYVAAILGVFFAVILASQMNGYWEDKRAGGGNSMGTSIIVPKGDSLQIVDIKGRMTVRETATSLGIPLSEVYAAFSIPSHVSPDLTLLQMREVAPDFTPGTYRAWLEERLLSKR